MELVYVSALEAEFCGFESHLGDYGGVAERLIASVLKTEDGKTSVGSNPTTSSKCSRRLIG